MIHNHDRSGWIGASDTYTVMNRWDTKTFERFWRVKLGLDNSHFENNAMRTGTAFEHKILDAIGVSRRDRQIRLRNLRLRVNLDGEDRETVYEVKTYGKDCFAVSRAYWMQSQVEMFATGKKLQIVAYRLEVDDYGNWLRPIDPTRLSFHPVEYDWEWIAEGYLPRLYYLAACLREGRWPHADFDS